MSLRPISFQPVQGGQLGLGSGTTSALASLINQQEAQEGAMQRAILGQVGSGIREKLQRDVEIPAKIQIQQMRQPGVLLQQAGSVFNAAKIAGDAGDFQRQQQLNNLGQSIVSGAFGGGSGLQGAMAPQEVGSPALPSPQTGLPSGGQIPSQPLPEETETPTVDPQQGISTPGAVPTGIPLSAQEKVSKAIKGREAAQQAKINITTLDSLSRVQQLPDGSPVRGSGGSEFEGVDVNPFTRNALEFGKQFFANDNKKLLELRRANRDEAQTALVVFDKIEDIGSVVSEDVLPSLTTAAAGLPGGLKVLKKVGAISGEDAKTQAKAVAARRDLKGLLSTLARKVGGEKGNLADKDVERAEGLTPSIFDDPETFKEVQTTLAELMLPKIMSAAFLTGDVGTFNQAQKRYRDIVGQNFDFQAGLQGRVASPEAVNLQPTQQDQSLQSGVGIDNNARAREILGL